MKRRMIGASILAAILAAALVGAQENGDDESEPMTEVRTWTDASGQFTVEAAMLKVADGAVHLQKADGQVTKVPLGKLSKDDQKFVRDELAKRKKTGRTGRSDRSSSGRATHTAGGENWPGWLGPNRDGKSPDTGLLKQWPEGGPPLLWKASGIGRGYSSVTVVDGLVYISGMIGDNEVLTALDMEGQQKWQVENGPAHTQDYPGTRSSATYDSGNLYLLSGNGRLGCFDAATGKSQWAHELSEYGGEVPGWAYAESVLMYKDLAIVTPGGEHCIVALDKKTGRQVWGSQFRAGAQYGSCIAVNYQGAEMIIAGTAEGIIGVDAGDGHLLWGNPFSAQNTANCPTPAYADGYVVWANGYGKGGICLRLNVRGKNVTATEAWTTNDMVCHHGGYIIHEGHIYGNHAEGWVCLDLRTGERKWRERGVGKGSLCYADGMLYLFAEEGGHAALATCSPRGLELRGDVTVEGQEMSWAHPVVIGGRLYLRFEDNLYCFNVRE
jgi:outer membrane protein assembly factor BamB